MDRQEVFQAVAAVKELPVMEAWLRGEAVEIRDCRTFDGWKEFKGEQPAFGVSHFEWRIKPVPRRWWIVESADGSASRWASLDEARKNQADSDTIIEVVEVLR
jgi:hypothetical protein